MLPTHNSTRESGMLRVLPRRSVPKVCGRFEQNAQGSHCPRRVSMTAPVTRRPRPRLLPEEGSAHPWKRGCECYSCRPAVGVCAPSFPTPRGPELALPPAGLSSTPPRLPLCLLNPNGCPSGPRLLPPSHPRGPVLRQLPPCGGPYIAWTCAVCPVTLHSWEPHPLLPPPPPSPPPTLPGAPSQEVAQLSLPARVRLFHPHPCRHRAWHQAGGQGPECGLSCDQRASGPVYSLGQVGALGRANSRVLLPPKPTSLVLAIHP